MTDATLPRESASGALARRPWCERRLFGQREFATVVGLMVAASCISASPMSNSFTSCLAEPIELPKALCPTTFVVSIVGEKIEKVRRVLPMAINIKLIVTTLFSGG